MKVPTSTGQIGVHGEPKASGTFSQPHIDQRKSAAHSVNLTGQPVSIHHPYQDAESVKSHTSEKRDTPSGSQRPTYIPVRVSDPHSFPIARVTRGFSQEERAEYVHHWQKEIHDFRQAERAALPVWKRPILRAAYAIEALSRKTCLAARNVRTWLTSDLTL